MGPGPLYLNEKRIPIAGDTAFSTLVEFLREQRGSLGTKVGCAEGDCGACSVLVGVPEDGTIRYRAVASCIQPLHQLDGTHVVTIEGLTPDGDRSSDPAGDGRSPRLAVRILHPGVRRRLEGVFESENSGRRRRAADGPGRQPLPMHRLSAHPRSRTVGR